MGSSTSKDLAYGGRVARNVPGMSNSVPFLDETNARHSEDLLSDSGVERVASFAKRARMTSSLQGPGLHGYFRQFYLIPHIRVV